MAVFCYHCVAVLRVPATIRVALLHFGFVEDLLLLLTDDTVIVNGLHLSRFIFGDCRLCRDAV